MSTGFRRVTLAPPGSHEVDGILVKPPEIVPVELDDQPTDDPTWLAQELGAVKREIAGWTGALKQSYATLNRNDS